MIRAETLIESKTDGEGRSFKAKPPIVNRDQTGIPTWNPIFGLYLLLQL